MAVNWTIDQQRAIEENGNLLISAAAGSGKTAVLTARIVRLIQEGANVDELLVVTFTNAAAAEMKKRIARALNAEAEQEPDEKAAARLREQALLSGRANISTLHSFCLYVLRRNFYDAGLDPAFRTAEAAEAAVLQQEALAELFEDRYAAEEEHPAFRVLLNYAGGEATLAEWIDKVYSFAMAQPAPFEWLDTALSRYTDPALAEAGVLSALLSSVKDELASLIRNLEDAVEALSDFKPRAHLDEELMRLRALLLARDYDTFRLRLFDMEFKTLRFARDEDPSVSEPIKAARDAVKDALKAAKKACYRSLSEEGELLRELAPAVEELFSLVKELYTRYGEKKSARALVDFNDMEHMTLKLLSDERIAEEYRHRFTHVFMDEYQDSNRVQEAIISRVRREDNLFLVGDVKQSIYRFRMAEPRLFLEKYDSFNGSPVGTRIDLNANFRSAENIIDFINSLFENLMSRELGEIDYDDSARLYRGREEQQGGQVECHFIAREQEPEFPEEGESEQGALLEQETAALEAMLAADRIRKLMDQEGYRYSDFAVLLRTVKDAAPAWVQALTLSGIPAYAELTGGYFDAVEVSVMLDLLRIIDNRRQDIPLMNVLRSPIGNFSAEELASLRIRKKEGSFFEALCSAAESSEADALSEKASTFLGDLARWRAEAGLVSVEELIGMLLDETGFYHFAGALPGGSARQANLNALLSRARAFEQGGSRSLSGFLGFMEKVKNSADFGTAPTGGMDVVRILSIHKSKGLEFPVVFLAGLGKRFNPQDKSGSLILDDELGLGLRVRRERRKTDTLYRREIARRQWRRQLSEEMRLLYVGMTRAKARLIMIGTVGEITPLLERYKTPMPPAGLSHARGMMDWIIYALLQTPEGNPLRAIGGLPARGGEGKAEIHVYQGQPAVGSPAGLTEKEYRAWAERAAAQADPEARAALCWEYPYLAAANTPTKASASSGAGRRRSELHPLPAFLMPEQGLNAADRGTAAHLLLQHIPFIHHTKQSVIEAAQDLCACGIMTEEQARAVPAKHIAAFFDSPLGQRLIASPHAERELQFNLEIPASRLGYGPAEENVMVQGVIDCCFWEPDGWVLLDYKTDRIIEGSTAEQTAEKHRPQVELYAEALSRLSGKPVREMHVFLLTSGVDIRL